MATTSFKANWFSAWLGLAVAAHGQDPAAASSELRQLVRSNVSREYPSLFELYKALHLQPELSFHEEKTAARIAQELKSAGFEVTERVGRHGVVGVYRNGNGPTVLVRTDLDALPVQEQTGLPYSSRARALDDLGNDVPVMHACGHDAHMTVFVGTARLLAMLKDRWQGTLVMLGQPAEEKGGGARAVLKDGLFKRFPRPDYCLALHVNANLPAGSVGYTEGFTLANVDSLDVVIRGVGGHGAWPHTAKDPIVLAAQTVLALQTIVSRETEPGQPSVITVGSIHGGTKHNIIPDEVRLELTLRSYTDEVRSNNIASIRRITRGLAEAAGVPEDRFPSVQVRDEFTPALYNQPDLTGRLAATFRSWLGEDKVSREKPVMGGEDFSEFGRTDDRIPICLFWLGAIAPERVQASRQKSATLPSLHSPFFRPDPEPTIKTGVTTMTAALLELTGRK